MSLLSSTGAFHKLTHVFAIVLLFVGYFNSSLISQPLQLFLQLSHLTGQFLVDKFLSLCNCIIEIVKLTFSFFQIVYEDALTFIKDVGERFTYVIWILKECFEFLETGVDFCLSILYSICDIIYNGVISVSQLGSFALSTLVSTTQVLHLTGSTIWIFITSIPEKTIGTIYDVINFLAKTKNDVVKSLIDLAGSVSQKIYYTYMLIFDIPLDSVYGLIVGGVLVAVLCVKFKDICLMMCSAFLKLYKCAISFGVCLWTGRFLEHKSEPVVYGPDDDERLCVVCQYHVKEIITLPCKHLCLCWECSDQIMETQQTCPVCRTHIREALKVYM